MKQQKNIGNDLVYPWFIDPEDEEEEGISDKNRCRIPDLLGKQIRASYHGWVILSNPPNNVMWSLWNPLTSKVIRLPALVRTQVDFKEYCLSLPPDDPSSIFLLTTDRKPIITFCRLDNKINKLRWSKMSYTKQLRSIIGKDGCLHCPTCYNSKVYALHTGDDCDDFVIHVDIVVREKQVVISLFPFLKLPKLSFNLCPSAADTFRFIKGSCTELFYFEIRFNDVRETSEVILIKLNVTTMAWEEMEDLNNAMFFVNIADDDYQFIFYMSQVASEFGGYIHILDEFIEGRKIYSYHVKERTILLSSIPPLIRTIPTSSFCYSSKTSFYNRILCILEADHGEVKCTVHSKQEEEVKDNKIVVRSIKDNNVEFNGKLDESRLLNLPVDVLEMIMEHSVGVEYMNFRATCKRCYLAAPLIPRSNQATLKRLQTYLLVSAWFMVLDKHRGIITFRDPLSGDKYFMKTPQELMDFKIYCSSFGWLLMFNDNGSMLFYNPFTSDIRKLPNATRLESCCFSSPPTSPECMVVGFIRSQSWKIYIHFVDRDFSDTFDLHLDGNNIYSLRNPTYHRGNLYALCNEDELYILRDVGKEAYLRNPLLVKAPIGHYFISSPRFFQINCGLRHLVVCVGRFGESVNVHNSISRKHVIYICDTACLCLEAKTPETENKIYFPRFHNGKTVSYSRETGKYHTFNGKNVLESLMDFSGTIQHCYPHAWIEPSLP